MATPEKTFENKIKNYLKEQDCWFVKYFGCAVSETSIPDLLCCVNGKFVAIEVKADKGKPSGGQLIMQHKIQKAGGISLILYPKDFEEFKNLIQQIKSEE